ncbi:MAG: histidine--tRNA ligase, partial [Bacteroidota bacterium]
LINEAEFVAIVDNVFTELNIPVLIKINNRKILSGIAEILDAGDKITTLTVAIDKYEKIGKEKVMEELKEKGFSSNQLLKLDPLFTTKGETDEKLSFLENFLKGSEIGQNGIGEIRETFDLIYAMGVKNEIELDISLARGLNYYTGAIIEVKALNIKIGSICGGGRYDDLTGIFGLPGVSGVGISFGADRIYDVLEQTNGFPDSTAENVNILFVNFGEKEARYILPLMMRLREEGINTEIYPDAVKMKKQMAYANSNNIPFVALVGEKEMQDERITLKDMTSGEQVSITPEALIERF